MHNPKALSIGLAGNDTHWNPVGARNGTHKSRHAPDVLMAEGTRASSNTCLFEAEGRHTTGVGFLSSKAAQTRRTDKYISYR